MNGVERENIIRSAVSFAKTNEIELSVQSWGIQYSNTKNKWVQRKGSSCCPLACLILANQKETKFQIDWKLWIVETLLECDYDWVLSFVNGWDGLPSAHYSQEAYEIAKSLKIELFHPTQLSLI